MGNDGKILVAGASGALGLEIVKILINSGLHIRALTRSSSGLEKLAPYTDDIWKRDAAKSAVEVEGLTRGVSTVISALGKSVSLFTPGDDSFYKTDFQANKNILQDAVKNKVKRFIYISIKGADAEENYTVSRAHKLFEEELENSGLEYTIIRPVGFFSGLQDLAIMAKRKIIPVIGSGEARTNSIHHADLAEVVVSYLDGGPEVVEVGGPLIHSRLEMAEMIREKVGGNIVKIPTTVAELGLEMPKFFEHIQDKLDYFKFVTTNDMIGSINGKITFKEYLENLNTKELP